MRYASNGAGRTISLAAAIIVLGSLLAACAGASTAGAGAPAAAPAAQEGARDLSGAGGASVPGAAPGDGQGSNTNGDPAAFKDGAKIIRTGSLQLEVTDVRAAIGAGRSAIQGMGGYIGASQQSSDGDNIVATYSYRIPAERWEDALEALRKLGNEVGEQTDSADVTGQIVDLDARIRNLRASESALVKHLSDAGKVADVLEIEARLSDVRGQIEQLTAQKANLDDQVAYATLTVTYGVEVQAVKVAADRWSPQTEVDSASASLVGFLQMVASAGIWLVIVGVPILVTVAIVVAAGWFVGRRLGLFRRAAGAPPAASAEG
jgi:hypothetical protein